MVIDMKFLELVTQKLRDYFHESNIKELNINKEFYWSIYENEKYDNYKEPSNFTVGQISENIENLREIVEGKREPTIFALKWLGEILIATGETDIRDS